MTGNRWIPDMACMTQVATPLMRVRGLSNYAVNISNHMDDERPRPIRVSSHSVILIAGLEL